MRERRGTDNPRLLCAGPGRLCEALAVTGAHDGAALDEPPFELRARTRQVEVVATPAHRDHARGGPAVALRAGGLALRQPRVTQSVIFMRGAAATPARGRCRTIFVRARAGRQPLELLPRLR